MFFFVIRTGEPKRQFFRQKYRILKIQSKSLHNIPYQTFNAEVRSGSIEVIEYRRIEIEI